jgi:hypothetical protein
MSLMKPSTRLRLAVSAIAAVALVAVLGARAQQQPPPRAAWADEPATQHGAASAETPPVETDAPPVCAPEDLPLAVWDGPTVPPKPPTIDLPNGAQRPTLVPPGPRSVPEPSVLFLLASGMCMSVLARPRRRTRVD